MEAFLEPLPDQSLPDAVAGRLRAAIRSGSYQPGDRLVERQISKQLGVSHIPVREALTRLEEEGRVDEAARYRRALWVNLVLNTGWSVLFWRVRRPALAAAEAGALAVSSADLARRAAASGQRAGWALVPYAAWTAFAAVLSTAIARRNRS